jgi:hypothetical protein
MCTVSSRPESPAQSRLPFFNKNPRIHTPSSFFTTKALKHSSVQGDISAMTLQMTTRQNTIFKNFKIEIKIPRGIQESSEHCNRIVKTPF